MNTKTLTKRFTTMALAFVLAVGLMPVMPWMGSISQAGAQESVEVASLPHAVIEESGNGADANLVAQAINDEKVTITGAAYYNYAHEVLKIVNAERAKAGVAPLTLDPRLTDSAMQRAAEITVFFEHVRPNGASCSAALPEDMRSYSGENIAAGQTSPQAVMDSWFYSEKKLYDEGVRDLERVGHYLNIINANYKSMGVGCFVQTRYYWTQEFSSATGSGNVRNDSRAEKRTIDIDYRTCGRNQGFNLNTDLDKMEVLNVGREYKMTYCIRNDSWSGNYALLDASNATWASSDTSICTVSPDGTVTAKGAGTATITARLGSGRLLTHQWAVRELVANASVSVPEQTYTGSPIEPNPAVVLNGRTLVRDTDYTVSYEYNTNVGVARLQIQGIDKYDGTKDVEFTIVPASITAVELSQTRYAYNGQDKWPDITVKSGDRVLTENADYYVTYPGDMRSIGNHTITVTGMGNHTGSMGATFEITEELAPGSSEPDPDDPGQVMYRLYNPNSGEHFYTASDEERWHLIDVGWNDEGTGWTAPTVGEPVYRLYNPYAGEHHYTPSAGERDALVAAGWNDEGIGWQTGGKTPLYRLYNPNAYANNHHYTTEAGERDILLGIGWRDEQVGWYGLGK